MNDGNQSGPYNAPPLPPLPDPAEIIMSFHRFMLSLLYAPVEAMRTGEFAPKVIGDVMRSEGNVFNLAGNIASTGVEKAVQLSLMPPQAPPPVQPTSLPPVTSVEDTMYQE